MSVLVLSCGRTGTNMTLELLMACEDLNVRQREERTLFTNPRVVEKDYLEKTDTVYVPDLNSIKEVMDLNPDLKIVWTVRDFRDVTLSKIYRGRAGGDTLQEADDASPMGCMADLRWMYTCCSFLAENYLDRLIVCKMEQTLADPDTQARRICENLGLKYNEKMQDFHERTRLETKKARYKNKIDKSQIALWKQMDTVYDGYFKDYDFGESMLFAQEMNYLFGYKD